MKLGFLLVVSLSLAAGMPACSSKKEKQTLGSAAELRVRAAKLGCDLKDSGEVTQDRLFPGQDLRRGSCDASIGPCNCDLQVFYDATAHTDELLRVRIGAFNCPKGSWLQRVFQLSDPLFVEESDRLAYHDLLASPPKVAGADANSIITATRPLRSVVIDGMWVPVMWKEVSPSPADQAFAEETVLVTIEVTSGREYSTTTKASPINPSSARARPPACADGSLRPWERKAQ